MAHTPPSSSHSNLPPNLPPNPPPDVPPPPPDAENPAIIDAEKTFRVTVISAILFFVAAAYIILRTRMG